MKRRTSKLTYTFVDPNTPQALKKALKAVIAEKLLAAEPEEPPQNRKAGR